MTRLPMDCSPETFGKIAKELEAIDQTHLIEHWEQLSEVGQHNLLEQLCEVDWPEVGRLVKTHVLQKQVLKLPETVEPAPWYPYHPDDQLRPAYQQARQLGEQLVAEGKVAAFTVAGGQGTRLGWDGPKGSFPATPIRRLSLFGCMAEYILNMQKRFDVVIPWYIMTSPANDAATRTFFQSQNYFGLDPQQVMLFPQQMMPALDMETGKVLMSSPDELALSPNGHGGSLKALYTSGAIADMQQRGIEQISYVQVDNPMVRVIDPLFIGLHVMDRCQMSSKMLPKRDPFEKLGNFCMIDGKMTVIEYSDLPDELAVQRNEQGRLRFLAGSIAIHAMSVEFVISLNIRAGGFALPFHRAEKKVPWFDVRAEKMVVPDKPNAVKLETFVFDALPLTDRSIIYETNREDEFAPIKNATGDGVLDSPETSMNLQIRRAADWLEGAGCRIPRTADGTPDAVIEISQKIAVYPDDLRKLKLPEGIEPGQSFLLE